MAKPDVKMAIETVQTSGLDSAPASDAVVDAWFNETFHNLALPTELYARFFAAKERLKQSLRPAEPAAPAEER